MIKEWYDNGLFNVSKKDIEMLRKLKENFDYSVFGVDDNKLQNKIDNQFNDLIEEIEKQNKINIGYAIAPYLFTWNFQRFKVYFQQDDKFDLIKYFEELGNFLSKIKDELKRFSNKKIYNDAIDESEIKDIFGKINTKLSELPKLSKLRINQNEPEDVVKICSAVKHQTQIKSHNEPIGVVKILHIFAPYYFPLIDNHIAETIGLKSKSESLTVDKYIKWMKYLKDWISKYDIKEIKDIEDKYGKSILKLIDEGLYIMCSVKPRSKIKVLGLKFKN